LGLKEHRNILETSHSRRASGQVKGLTTLWHNAHPNPYHLSAMGHERRFRDVRDESGLPPGPEILQQRSEPTLRVNCRHRTWQKSSPSAARITDAMPTSFFSAKIMIIYSSTVTTSV
jgi:hypothetical protein